jgi:hypothetical protein
VNCGVGSEIAGNVRWDVTLLLAALAVAFVVCAPDTGGAVGLANDFDLLCWCPWSALLVGTFRIWNVSIGMSLVMRIGSYAPEKGFVSWIWNSPDGGGAMDRGIVYDLVCSTEL